MDSELLFIARYDVVFLWILVFTLGLTVIFYTPVKKGVDNLFPIIGWIIVIGTALYLGNRELDIGVDTRQYNRIFRFMEVNSWSDWDKWTDCGFYFLMWITAKFCPWNTFLTIIALIYIGGAYIGMKGLFGKMALFSLFVFVISPNFFQFSINVMRNGYAASVFAISFFYYKKPKIMYSIMAFSCLCHISMILPFVFFIITRNTRSIQIPFILWCVSLMLQLSGRSIGSLAQFFLAADLYDGYINGQMDMEVQSWGSFLMYGMSPVLVAIYFIGVKKYKDRLYTHLLNTFLITQAIYVQVMNVEFALRFAYLSTFLMPYLLLYPLLKNKYWNYQLLCISFILTVVFVIKTKDLVLDL